MLLRLLLLFTLVPAIELILLLKIGSKLGLGWTVLIIVLTGAIGARLARMQGAQAWKRIQSTLAAGQLPGSELVDGLLILIAGALLITPGFFTDIAGFSLLLPAFRAVIRRQLSARFKSRMHVQTFGAGPGGQAGQGGFGDQFPGGMGDAGPDPQRPRRAADDIIEVQAETVSDDTSNGRPLNP